MTVTVEELAQKLEEEIAARKLLENTLAAQSSSMKSIENRLGSQIQTVSSRLETGMQDAEEQMRTEGASRSNEDQALRQLIDSSTKATNDETEARTTADNFLQQQVKANAASIASMDSSIASLQSKVEEDSNAIYKERLERMNSHAELQEAVQNTGFELKQKMIELQSDVKYVSSRVDAADKAVEAEKEAREASDAATLANTVSIESIKQEIIDINHELDQMDERFLGESAVSDLVSSSTRDSLAAQTKDIQDLLAEDQVARNNEFSSVHEHMSRIQESYQQVIKTLNEYEEAAQINAMDIRKTFNLLLPKGTILPYAGDILDIPDGWQICNGTNGTPDLAEKILVGAHAVADGVTDLTIGKEGKTGIAAPAIGDEDNDSRAYYCVCYIMKMF